MDDLNSDHSAELCENSDTWLPWETEVPGLSGKSLNSLVEDKEIASRAVAFVVNSTRKGIVPLCTDVANLLRAKRSLEKKVLLLKKENEALRAGSRPISHSTSPTPASLCSDRSTAHDNTYHIHETYRPPSRCSQCSSTISDSPRFRTRPPSQQRSPASSRNTGHNASPLSQRSNNEDINRLTEVMVHSPATEVKEQSCSEEVKSQPPVVVIKGQPHRADVKSQPPAIGVKIQPPAIGVKGQTPEKNDVMTKAEVHVELEVPDDKRRHSGGHDTQQRTSQRTLKDKKQDVINDNLHEVINVEGSSDADRDLKYIQECLKQIEVSQCLDKLFIENELHNNPDQKVKDQRAIKQNNTHNSKHKNQSINRKWSRALSPSVTSVCSETIKGCKCSRCESAMLSGDEEVNDAQKFSVSYKLQVQLGDHVLAKGDKTGRISYIGHLDNTPDVLYVGLELSQPVGQHDGFYKGKRYFTSKKDHAIFIPLQEILCKLNKRTPKSLKNVIKDDKIEAVTEL